jgi:serine/threonine-protein kinase
VPGTLLNDRYRIVGMLGRGGMGEVYRADDLLLDQAVALKFLPDSLKDDTELLERFFGEVRIARQITHPAVCRTHDVAYVEGRPFLSMEFVDGEDLKSLLRRIGRLPSDKALEIARQLCAGIAAAHERGVLHRDLKPDNVMIDGEGRVRITDFGLAAVAESIEGHDVRSGTPAYMAPEQLAGSEVTTASDIYGLGLVLYELFTGKRAFSGRTLQELMQQHAETDVAHPSSLVSDIDPGVERVILHCLEKDPARRPASALAVSASLPGADPLAVALAAGETPSPELVAAAGQTEGLRPAHAWAALGFALLGLVALPLLSSPSQLIEQVPVEQPPPVLVARAQEILERIGHEGEAVDTATGINVDFDYFPFVRRADDSPERWDGLATGRPPVFFFWYRQSPRPLVTQDVWGRVDVDEPARTLTGMAMVIVDGSGRLVELATVPPQVEDDDPSGPPPEPDWGILFEEAGLDIATFTPVPSRWTPPSYADTRTAWTGVYPERPDQEVRVEAAAYAGRPIYFQLFGEWSRAWRMTPYELTTGQAVANAIGATILFVGLLVSAYLARRNWRLGRGDRRGAVRLAVFALTASLISWALGADHVLGRAELGLFVQAVGLSMYLAAALWLLYMAIEPYVRKLWPHRLISWTRVLAGSWRDPLVGRDVLIGSCMGAAMACCVALFVWLPTLLGVPSLGPQASNLDTLLGSALTLSAILDDAVESVVVSMGFLLLVLLLRLLLRRESLAALLLIFILGLQQALWSPLSLWVTLPFGLLIWTIPILVLLRFGLLSMIVGMFVVSLVANLPITSRLGHWTGTTTLWVMAVVAVVSIWGFWTSLGGRSLLGDAMDS